MAAGVATLEELQADGVYEKLDRLTLQLTRGIRDAAKDTGVPVYQTRMGSKFCTFFTDGEVTDFASAKRSDTGRYGRFFHGMLERGVYLAPSQFEVGFVSLAHTTEDIDRTVAAARAVMETL